MFICQTRFPSCCVCGSVSISARHSRKRFLGISMEFLAQNGCPSWHGHSWSGWETAGQVSELKLARQGIKAGRTVPWSSVSAGTVISFHCMLFVLYYKEEKSSKNVEKSCFCHSKDGKASRLSKILANGGSCFQPSSICNFPKVPHLLCCRAGILTPVSYKENDGTQTA